MFKSVLVANRGEIAVRVLATCRRLGIETVAIHSDADAQSLHVLQADRAIHIGGSRLDQSYLDHQSVLRAVAESGAEAVHPGYGLLSENADFASGVREAGACFVGPSPETLRVFGDKIAARALASSVGVLPPPGSQQAIDPADTEGLRAEARKVGLPLIVKAAGGGGGIGMQIVLEENELAEAARRCSDRGRSAFGDDRVYLERYLAGPRHIEVQALGDGGGRVWIVGDRECSVQRRHQKVVEEAPAPAASLGTGPSSLRHELWMAAKRILLARTYLGAATVEFVLSDDGNAYFLEVNPRLQVEHGITELTGGVDLVECQLRLAAGEGLSLPELPEPRGHAIEVRLYAEDPDKGFIPQPGELKAFDFPENDDSVRLDTGLRAGDAVTPYYDPLLAKLMTHAHDRATAIEKMEAALSRTTIELVGKKGPKATNLTLLKRVMASSAFRSGQYDTHLLSEMLAAVADNPGQSR